MILDSLQNAGQYERLHPAFAAAFAFLRRVACSPAALPPGRHEIDGENVFALVSESAGRGREKSPLEAHRRHIDIQYVVRGTDVMGWRPVQCCTAAKPYDPEKDIEFHAEQPETWLEVPAGRLAIFFPEDAHAPLAGEGLVRKVVVKVRV